MILFLGNEMNEKIPDTAIRKTVKSFLEEGTQIENPAIEQFSTIVHGHIKWLALEAEKTAIYRGNRRINKVDVVDAYDLLFGDSE